MKYHVGELPQAQDPNSGTRMDMWVVWAYTDGEGIWQFAYCTKPEYAEHIKRLLEARPYEPADE